MSLSDAIAAYRPKGCATCNWLRDQPDKERAAFDAWLEDHKRSPRSYPLSDLQDICERHGLPSLSPRSFRDHCAAHYKAAA